MGATGGRDTLLGLILDQLRILRAKLASAGIGDLPSGEIIIGDATATNQTMPLLDQIDFQIDDVEEGKQYVLVPNNFQKGEIVVARMYLNDGTADVTITNNGGAMGGTDPAAVTDTETAFTITSGADFVVNSNLILTVANLVTGETLYGSVKIKVLP